MKLCHDEPCAECPWRKIAPAGWLGGWPAEYYADAVQANEVPACHMQDFGADDDRTAMCAGALSVMVNGAQSAWRTEGGDEARAEVGKREDTFTNFAEFYKYHTGRDWVHPLARRIKDPIL